MKFPHDDKEWRELLEIAARDAGLGVSLVEKDYWVTHSLWALQASGLEVWFKGGTSLSKAFGLIKRFSEDLDLKVEPGELKSVAAVENWKSEGTKATNDRRQHFTDLSKALKVPDCKLVLDENFDETFRNGRLEVHYPSRHAKKSLRCIHPLVTLIKKLDALQRRAMRDGDPAGFVRHYEDAARIIEHAATLPILEGYANARALADEMLAQKQIQKIPTADDPAFGLPEGRRTKEIEAAYEEITPMFWGPRLSLEDSCSSVREWIKKSFW